MSSLLTSVPVGLSTLVWTLAQVGDPTVPTESPAVPTGSLILAIPIQIVLSVVIGAIVLAIAPQTSKWIVDRIRSDPGISLLFGVLVYVIVIISVIVLAITVIGIVVIIPGVIVFGIVLLVGNVLTMVAVGTIFVGESNYWVGLAIGAIIVALLSAIPILGVIVRFVIASTGLGAIAFYFSDNW